ncbi:Rha family transcriptional regulator [Escherichia coli]|uniref:toxin YdaT family protein n=1 Tax=Escherichia coli TaxID=562 RepID=UPI000B3EFAF7|nr:toxin YdaT family protein [Escherichia coli]OVC27397.1 Rha family transcriptional regulator [Escherichia coli]
MKIKHEHIRMAMNAWAYPDGEKVPAAEIARTYFELGMTFPELYDDSHPEALARNTQKIFRWLDKDTPDAVEKMQALLPAIEKAMPPLLVARMRSHSPDFYREIVERRDRPVTDVDEFVAAANPWGTLTNSGGQPGNRVVVH